MGERILEDVVGLTVAADAPATNSLVHFCLQLGYQVNSRRNGDVALHGPGCILQLIPATENVRGIREIKMRTRSRSKHEEEHQLGHSVLKFVDLSAIWSFH